MYPRHCTSCGAELAEGASFCTSCGAPVKTAEPSRCPSCGGELTEGTSFCTHCGAGIKAGAPAARAAPVGPAGAVCPRCSSPAWDSVYCNVCHALLADRSATVERATLTRRYFGDYLLEFLLFFITLGLGWFVWLVFTARRSQTPAKSLLNVYILEKSGARPASPGKVFVREVLVKWLLFYGILGGFFMPGQLLNVLWATWDKDRQALHDKVAGTIVVYAPLGLPVDQLGVPIPGAQPARAAPRPAPPVQAPPSGAAAPTTQPPPSRQSVALKQRIEELQRLKEEGVLTEEEFEKKRKEAVEKL